MKILHLSNSFYPQVTGGTEIFIDQLIEAQRASPIPLSVRWAAHQPTPQSSTLFAQPSPKPGQILLPPVPVSSRKNSVAAIAPSVPGFIDLLDRFQPNLLHLHSLSERCGLAHARAAKERGIRVVVTVHAPGFTCMQGSLMHHRRRVCDGVIKDRRCTECRLVNGGLPAPLAQLVAVQSGWPISCEQPGTPAHVLTARQLTQAFRLAWLELVGLVDKFHVLAEWSRQVLLRNSVPAQALQLIRTAGPKSLQPRTRQPMEDGVLRLVYWGRCAEVKGLHLVIDAIRALPKSLPIELSFYGPYWDDTYGQAMRQRIAGDHRFKLMGTLPKEELLLRLQAYDLAVVPSIWLETGPLTVLEAFAAGLPVAGSDLGGIAELLTLHGTGKLLPMTSAAWAEFFCMILHKSVTIPAVADVPFRSFDMLERELFDQCYR
jgi:glycosyltransferase involved in cell wall biosynthesis